MGCPKFGGKISMPASAFQSARESHGLNSPVIRLGMYVPTRGEVATRSVAELYPIVIDWMWESPSELIPNNKQIAELRAIPLTRPNTGSLALVR
jgi:hypothetical protein